MDKITLDKETFKVLASDSRLDILKALDHRQKTITELSAEVDLDKGAVHRHLELLASVGLVQKDETERKWVYYSLTWKGKRILHPEKITIALLLSASLGALVTGAAAFWLWVAERRARLTGEDDDILGGGDAVADPRGVEGMETFASGSPALLVAAVALVLLCLALALTAWWMARRARSRQRVLDA